MFRVDEFPNCSGRFQARSQKSVKLQVPVRGDSVFNLHELQNTDTLLGAE